MEYVRVQMESKTVAVQDPVAIHASKDFRTGGVLLISLCHFIHDVYSSFLSPLLPLLIEKLSLSLTRAGLLSTVMHLPAVLNPVNGGDGGIHCRYHRPAKHILGKRFARLGGDTLHRHAAA